MLRWRSRIVFGQSRSRIWVLCWSPKFRFGSFRIMNLRPTKVTVFWSLYLQVVQHAFIEYTLSFAATARNQIRKHPRVFINRNLLLEMQIATGLVQTIGILPELLSTGLLHLPEEFQGTISDGFSLIQTLPRVAQLTLA